MLWHSMQLLNVCVCVCVCECEKPQALYIDNKLGAKCQQYSAENQQYRANGKQSRAECQVVKGWL